MRTYDRADLKRQEIIDGRRSSAAWWDEYYDLYDFFYQEVDNGITIDDVRTGMLFVFLIKLRFQSPKRHIDYLHW